MISVVEFDGESLKTLLRVKPTHVDAGEIRENRLMLIEADVDDIPPVGHRLPCEGLGEQPELVDTGYLPNHVVPQSNIIQNLIHAGIAAQDRIKGRHMQSPPLHQNTVKNKTGQRSTNLSVPSLI